MLVEKKKPLGVTAQTPSLPVTIIEGKHTNSRRRFWSLTVRLKKKKVNAEIYNDNTVL